MCVCVLVILSKESKGRIILDGKKGVIEINVLCTMRPSVCPFVCVCTSEERVLFGKEKSLFLTGIY